MAILDPGSRTEFSDNVRDGLRHHFQVAAEAVVRSPGRVNLMGEHTDYNRGLVLPVAIPHSTYVAAARRSDQMVRLRSQNQELTFEGSLADCGPGKVHGWPAYAAGVLWALHEAGVDVPGVDIFIDSSLPLGSGLASSASLESAVALAVVQILRLRLTPELRKTLVNACVRAETEVAQVPVGAMDQTIALFAQPGTALLLDFALSTHKVVPLPLRGRSLLVTDTNTGHKLNDGWYAARRTECVGASTVLRVPSLRDATLADVEKLPEGQLKRRARHIVTENARVPLTAEAFQRNDWKAVGRLFAESHQSIRDDFEVSSDELDLAVKAAIGAGADGARMTGGGMGGSIISVVPTLALESVSAAIDEVFHGAGYSQPRHLVATPSGAASTI